MTILLGLIVAGVIYSAYNLGCIWAYKRHAKDSARKGKTDA